MNSVRSNYFSFKYQRFTHIRLQRYGDLKNSIDLIQLNLLKENAKYRTEIYNIFRKIELRK